MRLVAKRLNVRELADGKIAAHRRVSLNGAFDDVHELLKNMAPSFLQKRRTI